MLLGIFTSRSVTAICFINNFNRDWTVFGFKNQVIIRYVFDTPYNIFGLLIIFFIMKIFDEGINKIASNSKYFNNRFLLFSS